MDIGDEGKWKHMDKNTSCFAGVITKRLPVKTKKAGTEDDYYNETIIG